MTVVANSSVLISLSAIGQLDLLRKKYKEVLIPQAVWEEVVVEMKALRQSQGERFGTPLRGSKVEIRGSLLVGVVSIPFIVGGPGTMLQPERNPGQHRGGAPPKAEPSGRLTGGRVYPHLQRGGGMSIQNGR